jgi:hypothetical protein
VLRLLMDGRSNRQIAERLFISGKTASVHVTNILAKLGVHSRLEAAATARRLGLDQPAQEGSGTCPPKWARCSTVKPPSDGALPTSLVSVHGRARRWAAGTTFV